MCIFSFAFFNCCISSTTHHSLLGSKLCFTNLPNSHKEMKQCRITLLVKELSVRIRREVREGSLQITTTIILCLSMAFFVVILGIFINDHVRKFIVSEEFYLPQLTKFSQLSPWSPYSQFLCNTSLFSSPTLPPLNSSTSTAALRDLLAPKELWHSMNDKELMWRASMVPHAVDYPYDRTPKVAFMFLSRGRLPLASLWEKFFKGHVGLYSIYLHNSLEYNTEMPESSVFYKRRIPSKVRTCSGKFSFQIRVSLKARFIRISIWTNQNGKRYLVYMCQTIRT